MEEQILKLLGRKRYLPSTPTEILEKLSLPPDQERQVKRTLRDLERNGLVARIKGQRYIRPKEADLIPGRIQITRSGRGFLVPDEPGVGEIAISSRATGVAMHDDRVLVRLDVRPRGRRKSDDEQKAGSVVRVLERKRNQIVGTFQSSRQTHYVVPDDSRFQHDITVGPAKDTGRPARPGDKVVVELTEWKSQHHNPEGTIIEVLGPPTAEGVDMLSVIRQYDLPLKFPPAVLKEAKKIGTTVSEADMKGRLDCRSHDVITIDPADARDFDDAFFLERTRDERWRLWVHIADVSHYVKPGSALDQEARNRGNSTYLVDRVIPMLPEALSNELCSLKPQVDRLSKCVEFLIDDTGRVVRTKFHQAVIHSKRRYSYEEAFAVLNRKPQDEIESMLCEAGKLAMKIRKLRFANGSLDLDFPETKIRLDDEGKVLRIEKVDNDLSHQLIEEFMLLANEAVAAKLMRSKTPTVYRVHESPDPKRLFDFREEVLSHNLPCGNLEKTIEVQRLLKRLASVSIGAALKISFLKSLMRARYAVEPLGHYGLAKTKYAHFTSPIRRYADLLVHRSLFEKRRLKVTTLQQAAEHISTTERNSADAERDSKDVKLYAFLKQQLESKSPQAYHALVTDIRNFGLFIDVPDLGMRGLIHLSEMDDDFYEFDSARVRVIGRRRKKVIQLGDSLRVRVSKVDSFKKEVDFTLDSAGKKPSQRSTKDNPRTKSRSTSSGKRKSTRPKRSYGKKHDQGKPKGARTTTKRTRPKKRNRR